MKRVFLFLPLKKSYLFSSESVSEGHPDKVADQISDAVLDAALVQDLYAKVACETLITRGLVVVAGELRHSGRLPWLRPDGKSQVSVRYDGGRPQGLFRDLVK